MSLCTGLLLGVSARALTAFETCYRLGCSVRVIGEQIRTLRTVEGSELMCPISGLAVSARRLRLHQMTHEDDVGAGSFRAPSTVSEESVFARGGRRSPAGSSPSDLTNSSSDSGDGDVGREERSDRWSCSAVWRHVMSASMRGEPS